MFYYCRSCEAFYELVAFPAKEPMDDPCMPPHPARRLDIPDDRTGSLKLYYVRFSGEICLVQAHSPQEVLDVLVAEMGPFYGRHVEFAEVVLPDGPGIIIKDSE